MSALLFLIMPHIHFSLGKIIKREIKASLSYPNVIFLLQIFEKKRRKKNRAFRFYPFKRIISFFYIFIYLSIIPRSETHNTHNHCGGFQKSKFMDFGGLFTMKCTTSDRILMLPILGLQSKFVIRSQIIIDLINYYNKNSLKLCPRV